MVLDGYMAQSLALLDLVGYIGDAVLHVVINVSQLGFGKELFLVVLVEGVSSLYKRFDILLRQRQNACAVCSRDNLSKILGIQSLEFILADSAVMHYLSYAQNR